MLPIAIFALALLSTACGSATDEALAERIANGEDPQVVIVMAPEPPTAPTVAQEPKTTPAVVEDTQTAPAVRTTVKTPEPPIDLEPTLVSPEEPAIQEEPCPEIFTPWESENYSTQGPASCQELSSVLASLEETGFAQVIRFTNIYAWPIPPTPATSCQIEHVRTLVEECSDR